MLRQKRTTMIGGRNETVVPDPDLNASGTPEEILSVHVSLGPCLAEVRA